MRRLLVPASMAAAMVLLAAALGVWQVERLRWKTDFAELSGLMTQLAAPPDPARPAVFVFDEPLLRR